jgi:hypothetical protein
MKEVCIHYLTKMNQKKMRISRITVHESEEIILIIS